MSEEIPQVGMHRTEDHRYYWNGQGPLTSVTTAISTYDKSDALVGWAKKETASFAMRHLPELVEHLRHTEAGLVDMLCEPCETDRKRRNPVGPYESARIWVSSISDYQRDAAADLGTRVHAMAEAIGKGDDPMVETELLPYGEQYRRWQDKYRPRFEAIEYMGVNRQNGYAGTGDILTRLDYFKELDNAADDVFCIDIKTFTKPGPVPKTYYPSTGMQLAACSRFDFIGKPNDPIEYPMPQATRFGVLLLGASDYRLIPYKVTDATFAAFLATLDLHEWKNGEAKRIVGAA